MKVKIMPIIAIVIFGLIVSLVFSSVPKKIEKAPRGKITIVDDLGRETSLSKPVKKIVVVSGTYNADIICALGKGDKIVGIMYSPKSQLLPELRKKESVGESWVEPNLEKIRELNPDVVIANPYLKKEVAEKLEEWGMPILCFRSYTDEEVHRAIEQFGKMLGKEKRAKELWEFIESKLNLIKERVKDLKPEKKPKVYKERYQQYHTVSSLEKQTLLTPWGEYSAKNLGNWMIEFAGGINCIGKQPVAYLEVDPEFVREANPDIIVKFSLWKNEEVWRAPSEETMKKVWEEVIGRRTLKNVKAVKEGKVYIIYSKILAGPRGIVGLCYFAKWFHPNLFYDISPQKIHEEMWKKFWGVELEGTWAYPPLK
ncbi:MAG: ABC transporter substrate-binding protein [bacterium]